MKSLLRILANYSAAILVLLNSCTTMTRTDARLTKSVAWRSAEELARQKGIPIKSYKRQKARYLTDKRYWCLTFEERGYFLAVGDQFAVFINDRSGVGRLVREVGYVNIWTKEKLEEEINKLKGP